MRTSLGRVTCSAMVAGVLAVGLSVAAPITSSSFGIGGADTTAQAKVISWKNAKKYLGKTVTIKGPVKSLRWMANASGYPTFINIGAAYPSPKRLTVLIWGDKISKFAKLQRAWYGLRGKTMYVTGKIRSYRGSAEIIATKPSQLKWK